MKAKCIYLVIDMVPGKIYEVKEYNDLCYILLDESRTERVLYKSRFELVEEDLKLKERLKFREELSDNAEVDIEYYMGDASIQPIIKTNKMKRSNGSTIKYKVKGNNLNVKIQGTISTISLLKLLLQEVDELKEFKYRRISPYKIVREFARDRKDRNHLWSIQFMDVKDQNKIKSIEIVRANWHMGIETGEYNYFIPDLLEVCKTMNLVKLDSINNIYIRNEVKFKKKINVEYLDDSFSRENLINKGWTVPTGYVEEN